MHRDRRSTLLAAVLTAVLQAPAAAQMHHPGEVECLAFSDDGRYLLTVTRAEVRDGESVESQVRVWDLDVGAAVRKAEGFQERYREATRHRAFYLTITSCQVEPPIVGVLEGSKVNFFDWQRNRLVGKKTLKRPTWARGNLTTHRSGAIPGTSAAFVEVGYDTGPKVVHAFEVPSGKPLPEVQRRIETLFESPTLDGLRTHDANLAWVDSARGAGTRVAFADFRGAEDKAPSGQPEQARVWDPERGEILATVPSDLTGPVALSRDGELVATVRDDLEARVFRVDSGRDYHLEKREQLAKKAEQMGVSVRHGYRRVSIGERHLPEVADPLYSESSMILYLDGRPVSVEQLTTEIDAERHERYRRSLSAKLREAEETIASYEQERWRHRLSLRVEVPDDYDPDYFNDVKVWITSAADSALRVVVRGPDGESFAVSVPARSARSHVVRIQGIPRDDLAFEVTEVAVEKPR